MNTYQPMHHNECRLCGTAALDPGPSHSNHGVLFFRFPLSVPRLFGQCDTVNIIVPETLLDICPVTCGKRLAVTGQLRSYNNKTGVPPRLVISVLARTLTGTEEGSCNTVRLCGTICKPPTYRRTPLGRQICDMILAVNRRYGRADYLPCIAWGTVAQQTALLDVGESLCLEGRIQSRTYAKTLSTGQSEERTAYEVSVMRPLAPEEVLFPIF